jgi:hypothetical protein
VTKFDVAYIVGGLLLVAFELAAVYKQRQPDFEGEKQTISHKVIAWIARKPKTRRVLVALGLLWLLYHWVFAKF